MNLINLTPVDLIIAALLILALAYLSQRMSLGMSNTIIVAAIRTTVQLLLIGWVLKILFSHVHLAWVALMALVMLLAAGREVMVRQQRRFSGWWGFGLGAGSMFISSFVITVLALMVITSSEPIPWYEPQYAVPLLGMLLGNTMNGVALGLDRLKEGAWQQRDMIEARLSLGENGAQAMGPIRRDSMRVGMIPIINAMAAAGIVSLPGMMTGQILAGSPPLEAVKYQILIMFLIGAGTGFGTICAVHFGAHRLFDGRDRLRLDRLYARQPKSLFSYIAKLTQRRTANN
ncbi:MAG TPA: iron export ABC transporter permease subunit FetB [Acidiferrobacteraceae bacterium]|nr:iron export ABC transporter permease subunit FetB [Acidiferrobacteraceae bacterium]